MLTNKIVVTGLMKIYILHVKIHVRTFIIGDKIAEPVFLSQKLTGHIYFYGLS